MKPAMNRIKTFIAAALVGALIAGCATDDPNRSAKTGVAIGAVLGAIAGSQINKDDKKKGAVIGAVVGALGGGAVGAYMDKQRAELERKLKAETEARELSITKIGDDALKIGIASDASFDVGSAHLKPDALNTYAKIASVLKDYDKTVIHIVGHTDSTGTDENNQSLSERRAATVGSYLTGNGLVAGRVREEGRGEREAIASNDSKDGKQKNRRVDIIIKPVIEGREEQAWTSPPYLGS